MDGMRKIIKSLMCRLIGHKDYSTLGGIRCERCGSAAIRHFITSEDLAVMRAQFDFMQVMRDGKR
jgi:hypothetical protein